jgi:MFS family permease
MSRDLIMVALALFTWGIGEGAFLYFQPLYLEELGASPIGIGTILGAVGIAMTVAHIPAGYLADRFGRRSLMWAAWISGLVSAWIMALSRSLSTFVIGAVLYGITAFVVSPMHSYITAARGELSVGRTLTLITAIYNAGGIIGPILGGIIGDRFNLQQIYFCSAISFFVSNILIFTIRPQPVESTMQGNAGSLRENRAFKGYMVIIFIVMFALYLPQPLTQNFLQNERGLSLRLIGTLGAIGSLGNVILSIGIGYLKVYPGFILSQISVLLSTLIIWKWIGMPLFALSFFLRGGYRVARSLSIAQVQELISSSNMGLAFGIAETAGGLATVLAPPFAGILYAQNPIRVFTVSMILIIFSLIVSLLFKPSPKKKTDPELQII